jgi:hypothetical protein
MKNLQFVYPRPETGKDCDQQWCCPIYRCVSQMFRKGNVQNAAFVQQSNLGKK